MSTSSSTVRTRVGVYGASGYAGQDTVDILRQHPQVELAFATSDNCAGQAVPGTTLTYIPHAEADLSAVDAVFLALPHKASAPVAAAAAEQGCKVVDLSADLRLDSAERYQEWYGVAHPRPDLLPTPYALVEVNRAALGGIDRAAVPGCYPTTTLLGLYPLLKTGALQPNAPIFVDAKSGVSGAGRAPKDNTHFVEVFGNLSPYNPGRKHRHVGEIEQEMHKLDAAVGPLIFTPHLLPVDRGLMSSIYVTLGPSFAAEEAQALYEEIYGPEPLVDVLPPGQQATLKHVVRTNKCVISLTPVAHRYLHITSVTDNLRKGAAGQAVQVFNLMMGYDETTALL
ncbi:MAG: N-acetyl-gamma-glutamyl-phosphate reductase [Chloroflexota bacterium]